MNRRTALKAIAALPMVVKGEIKAAVNPLLRPFPITIDREYKTGELTIQLQAECHVVRVWWLDGDKVMVTPHENDPDAEEKHGIPLIDQCDPPVKQGDLIAVMRTRFDEGEWSTFSIIAAECE